MVLSKPPLEVRITLVVGYVLLILVNVAASRGWIGPTNEKLSKKNPTPITPASYAFAIWGLIFLLEGAGVVFQAFNWGYEHEGKAMAVQAVGYFWVAGWTFQCLWQVLFQLQSRLGSWLCMFALVGALASFAAALRNVDSVEAPGWISKFLLAVPTSINTAWLSVATCIGILMVWTMEGLPLPQWGAVLLAGLATAAGIYRLAIFNDTAYALVLVWALLAVFQKQDRWPVGVAAAICAALCAGGAVITIFRNKPAFVKGDYIHSYSEL